MAITDQINTPLYAVVGAGDAIVAKVRATVPTQDDVDGVVTDIKSLPEQLKGLPEQAQSAALDALKDAADVYADLAKRGESLVGRIRRQKATEDLLDQVKTAESHAKATATTAKKSAKSTRTAAKGTATTAKKSAKSTRTSAKSTVTSAKKTATAAKKAASDAADKVGS